MELTGNLSENSLATLAAPTTSNKRDSTSSIGSQGSSDNDASTGSKGMATSGDMILPHVVNKGPRRSRDAPSDRSSGTLRNRRGTNWNNFELKYAKHIKKHSAAAGSGGATPTSGATSSSNTKKEDPLLFPSDDVSVVTEKRQWHTIRNPVRVSILVVLANHDLQLLFYKHTSISFQTSFIVPFSTCCVHIIITSLLSFLFLFIHSLI